jgi:hypothetical protein
MEKRSSLGLEMTGDMDFWRHCHGINLGRGFQCLGLLNTACKLFQTRHLRLKRVYSEACSSFGSSEAEVPSGIASHQFKTSSITTKLCELVDDVVKYIDARDEVVWVVGCADNSMRR